LNVILSRLEFAGKPSSPGSSLSQKMHAERDLPVIGAQAVLRGNGVAQVWRLMWGLVASAEQAQRAGLIASLELALGDCSEVPLSSEDVQDLTKHALDAGLSDLTYDFFGENLGHSGGHNRLARRATNELLLLINPDAYPSPTMIVELINALSGPKVGIAEARQIPFEHPKEFDPATGDTSWVSGCCLLIPRSILEAVDGFSAEYFPLHCDDVDLSWRVRLAGFRVVHVPTAAVFHDKTLELSGYPRTSAAEVYHSMLGRLMLCVRYSKPEILRQTIDQVEAHGSEEQRKALKEFKRRESEGSLPAPLVGAERVAQFVKGEYARHRFESS
jgi:GT2 family glycosyltransferase